VDCRSCEQCGLSFVPRREHARFCCVGCRADWNREHLGDPSVDSSALLWSVTAMSEATARLPQAGTWDRGRACAVVGEAVWWVTLVDATLVRHHPGPYDSVLTGQSPGQRRLIEDTLGGLRFVRNQADGGAGLARFIHAARGPGAGTGRISGWRWKPVPPPALVSLPPRARAWEMTRYRAYRAELSGQTIGEVFWRAATFLTLTAAHVGSLADVATAEASPGAPARGR